MTESPSKTKLDNEIEADEVLRAQVTAEEPELSSAEPAESPDPGQPVKHGPLPVLRGVLRTARPRQWVKNVLVFAAPFFALAHTNDPKSMIFASVIAFISFSLVASSVYLINDAIDVAADREHPTKRNRPIAAGIVPVPLAYVAAVGFFGAGLGISFLASPQLSIVLGVYEAVQLGYCFGLKHQPVVDLAIVGSGFLTP